MGNSVPGLFITGTDTEVGKTYVGALIARSLRASGHRVGVYKPAASGCRFRGDALISDDALELWEAAGRPGELDRVCPQCFEAPLAPHLAAEAEGKRFDSRLLRTGIEYWQARSDVIVVEGVGGLMCPLGSREYVADLACDHGFPLIVVARNALGTLNHTLQTLHVAATFRDGLKVAGVVLNHPPSPTDDPGTSTNRGELATRMGGVMLLELGRDGKAFDGEADWFGIAE